MVSPTVTGGALGNALRRAGYRLARNLLRVWARLTHPRVVGATTLVWRGRALLLVRPSYQPWQSPPGGRVERREDPRAAAARELVEETGLTVEPGALECLGTWVVEHSDIEDSVHVFTCREADTSGELRIDGGEIVDAGFVEFESLGELALWPPLRVLLSDGLRPPPALDLERL